MQRLIFFILMILFSVGIFYSYDATQVPVDVEEELKKVATKEYFEERIQKDISSNNLQNARDYYDLAKYLNVPLDNKITNSLSISENKDWVDSSLEKGKDIFQGFVFGKTENEEQFYSSMASDFTVVGDARDFFKEGSNYVDDKPYNEMILGLSAIGLGLSASQVLTAGLSTPLKAGSSILKVTAKSGKLSKEFLEVLSQKISKTVDFKALKTEIDFSSLKSMENSFVKMGNAFDFSHIKGIATDLNTIQKNSSMLDTTKLLQYVDSEKDLQKLTQISSKYKKSSKTVMEILGKGILKATKTVIKYSALFIFELLGLIFSLIGFLFSSFFTKSLLRVFRK